MSPWRREGRERASERPDIYPQKDLSSLERIRFIYKIRINSVFITTRQVGANEIRLVTDKIKKLNSLCIFACSERFLESSPVRVCGGSGV